LIHSLFFSILCHLFFFIIFNFHLFVFIHRFSTDATGNHRAVNNGNINIPTSELLSIGLGSDSLPQTIMTNNNNQGMMMAGGMNHLQGNLKYHQQVLDMKSEGRTTLYVDWNDLYRFNDVLATAIAGNYYRYEPYLRAAVQRFIVEVLRLNN